MAIFPVRTSSSVDAMMMNDVRIIAAKEVDDPPAPVT
jgi:hypothetical protein